MSDEAKEVADAERLLADLNEKLNWYDQNSTGSRERYYWCKRTEIVAGVRATLFAAFSSGADSPI